MQLCYKTWVLIWTQWLLNHHWFIVPLVHIVRCRYKAGKFVQIQYKRRARYGVSICEFRVSFTFCLSHRIGVCNIVLYWAALWRHSTVLDFDPVISVITVILCIYMLQLLFWHLYLIYVYVNKELKHDFVTHMYMCHIYMRIYIYI